MSQIEDSSKDRPSHVPSPLRFKQTIEGLFGARPDVQRRPGTYWTGDEPQAGVVTMAQAEAERLAVQNQAAWTRAHRSHHHRAHRVFDPRTMAVIGVSPHGEQVLTLLRTHPNLRQLHLIDLTEPSIKGAIEVVRYYEPSLVRKLVRQPGEASEVLGGMTEPLDAVEASLVTVHIPDRDDVPLPFGLLNPGQPFPSLGRLVTSITDRLTLKGWFSMEDLAIRAPLQAGSATQRDLGRAPWLVYPALGREEDSDTLSQVASANAFLYGEPGKFPGAFVVGWDARKAHAWTGPQEMEQAIAKLSGERLRFRYHLVHRVGAVAGDSPMGLVMASMGPTILYAARKALMEQEAALAIATGHERATLEAQVAQTRAGIATTETYARSYVQALFDGNLVGVPDRHALDFVKEKLNPTD